MKSIVWLSVTYETIKVYPVNVRRETGYNLDKLQRGAEPSDWKPMTKIGPGVKEIRIHEGNEYRILYVTKFKEAIYILHSFVKKTQQTTQKEMNIGRKQYLEMLRMRRSL